MSKPVGGMPATDDEIREKYLERAIRELNPFTRDLQACERCPRGNLMPVLGSGHPQADVFLLKYAPTHAEIEEGVAFYGRAGTALMKSLRRLDIDPLAVYGTLCVKCPVADTALAAPECVARLVEELAIVQPKIVVVMGEEALRDAQRARAAAGARGRAPTPGELQQLTPSIDALYMPNIDDALDEEAAKRAFWSAFRVARRLVRRPAALLDADARATSRARSCRACRPPGSARRRRRPRRAGRSAVTGTLRSPEAKPGSTWRSTSAGGRRLVLERAGAQRRGVDAAALAHQHRAG